ncbi:hypothetical protein MCC93_25400 [Morococcus cerebrosus]|uniref:Uncharacterized protein n=1 Tax=Morococcus cerebrosus TaxID=1056807 RepID=A0A0C1GVY3_9NEIS|nr:hypothetical protein MCC93_25400 [Morococcus cerebrosus]
MDKMLFYNFLILNEIKFNILIKKLYYLYVLRIWLGDSTAF